MLQKSLPAQGLHSKLSRGTRQSKTEAFASLGLFTDGNLMYHKKPKETLRFSHRLLVGSFTSPVDLSLQR